MRQRRIVGKFIRDSRKNEVPILRILILWAAFFLTLIGVFLWRRIESARLLDLFQQSPICAGKQQAVTEENCREYLSTTVNQVSSIFSPRIPNRSGSGYRGGEIAAADVDIILPDGSHDTFRFSKEMVYQRNNIDSANNFAWAFLHNIAWLKKGTALTICRWRGKIITFRTADSPELLTMDHPENGTKINEPRNLSILALLFITLLIWTGYEVLRKKSGNFSR